MTYGTATITTNFAAGYQTLAHLTLNPIGMNGTAGHYTVNVTCNVTSGDTSSNYDFGMQPSDSSHTGLGDLVRLSNLQNPANWTGTGPGLNLPGYSTAQYFDVYVRSWSNNVATVTFTWTIDPDLNGNGNCACGASPKLLGQAAVQVGMGLIDALEISTLGPWAIPIIIAESGSPLLIPSLCAHPPHTDPTIFPDDWSTTDPTTQTSVAVRKTLQKFYASAFGFFCDCNTCPPGTGGGGTPIVINWSQPTSYVIHNVSNVSNTEISTVVNNLTQTQIAIQTTTNNNNTIVNQLRNCACGSAYEVGPLHPGLSGTGSFAVSGDMGILVHITTDTPNVHDEVGNPTYLWNRGFISVSDPNGMLDEHRLTRTSIVWFPRSMGIADLVSYWFPPGLEVSITELLPPRSLSAPGTAAAMNPYELQDAMLPEISWP